MRSDFSRREFIAGLGVLAAAKSSLSAAPFHIILHLRRLPAWASRHSRLRSSTTRFRRTSVTPARVPPNKFGMEWMELRSMWNKNIANSRRQRNRGSSTPPEKEQPARHRYRQPSLQSGLGRARRNRSSVRNTISSTRTLPTTSRAKFSIARLNWPKKFSTDRIRCFDFWRLDDQAPYRKAMNDQLQQAAEKLRKIGTDPYSGE